MSGPYIVNDRFSRIGMDYSAQNTYGKYMMTNILNNYVFLVIAENYDLDYPFCQRSSDNGSSSCFSKLIF